MNEEYKEGRKSGQIKAYIRVKNKLIEEGDSALRREEKNRIKWVKEEDARKKELYREQVHRAQAQLAMVDRLNRWLNAEIEGAENE